MRRVNRRACSASKASRTDGSGATMSETAIPYHLACTPAPSPPSAISGAAKWCSDVRQVTRSKDSSTNGSTFRVSRLQRNVRDAPRSGDAHAAKAEQRVGEYRARPPDGRREPWPTRCGLRRRRRRGRSCRGRSDRARPTWIRVEVQRSCRVRRRGPSAARTTGGPPRHARDARCARHVPWRRSTLVGGDRLGALANLPLAADTIRFSDLRTSPTISAGTFAFDSGDDVVTGWHVHDLPPDRICIRGHGRGRDRRGPLPVVTPASDLGTGRPCPLHHVAPGEDGVGLLRARDGRGRRRPHTGVGCGSSSSGR